MIVLNVDPKERLLHVLDTGVREEGRTHEETLSDAVTLAAMLEQIGTYGESAVYRCRNFARDADGLGTCAIYDRRPKMCRDFPQRAVNDHACSFNVRLVRKVLPIRPMPDPPPTSDGS